MSLLGPSQLFSPGFGRKISQPAKLGGATISSPIISVASSLILGYAGLASARGPAVTGGTGGQTLIATDWTSLKTAMGTNGTRTILLQGNAHINGLGETYQLTKSNVTIDGSGFHGSIRRASIMIRANNVWFKHMRLRSGDQVNSPSATDALTINPGVGGPPIHHIAIDHCSVSWGPDVCLAVLNQVEDLTIQYTIIGPGLQLSDHEETNHSMGMNVTVPGNGVPATEYGRRTAAAASPGLAATVVAEAGPNFTDSTDQEWKDAFTNGTGVFYNGTPATYPAPNQNWPPVQ
jgi:hypothetical protein